ncbi:5-dehydro-4-deoxy-D-glucuronate isomerase [Anaeroselena agilis]|uniref:4-deoxy-L-threo-5-hexosulose-uronate ketol-isomerase n=1 Tax=Anaeroselena agilis TaxID=3063788 RepID=A0ABU3NXL0_9FIRM|nr:5-dehydro-4-deoxy-D-glucuronate isomerase [Selenomonadales bacterium 4137-cl]
MEIRYPSHPQDVKRYTTDQLRKDFLIQEIFVPGETKMVYSHFDRIIAGGICPTAPLALEAGKEIAADFFLQRREIGIINIGAPGKVLVDGAEYPLKKTDGLYIGMGAQKVTFTSDDPSNPAKFYFNSTPAHKTYPTVKILVDNIVPAALGSISQSNERKIYKYIVPGGVESCQLVMGMTVLAPGNMWNSMPCHTHERRMEVYFYFDLAPESVVFHLMGEPGETRHVVIRNEEAIISPSWSIHSGVGTGNYTFIWGMAGENQKFDDMDHIPMSCLK